ncbi:hypothetical protein [Propionivibrio sp.]|uniref:hypothetical protein n=1 Tax=Propionivibrio sp. TaxID=2212460 RepID=UPI003BF0B419
MSVFSMKPRKPEVHMQLLGTIFLILNQVRREGLMSIEGPIDDPEKSSLFTAIAGFDKPNAAIYTVLCDALHLMVGGNLDPQDMARYLVAARKTTGLSEPQQSLFDSLELALIATLEGKAPQVAVEFGRQGIPAKIKPGYNEFEDFLRKIRTQNNSVMNREESDAALVSFFDGIAT